MGVILGMILIYKTIGSLDFSALEAGFVKPPKGAFGAPCARLDPWDPLDAIGILLLIGCIGKSAQLGLHT